MIIKKETQLKSINSFKYSATWIDENKNQEWVRTIKKREAFEMWEKRLRIIKSYYD